MRKYQKKKKSKVVKLLTRKNWSQLGKCSFQKIHQDKKLES